VLPAGAGRAYETYRRFLQLLTCQMEDMHLDQGTAAGSGSDPPPPEWQWMLKCPFHLPYLSELLTAFPDATVVWTHRTPVECVGSACSLYRTLFEVTARPGSVSPTVLGAAVADYTAASLAAAQRCLAARDLPFECTDIDSAIAAAAAADPSAAGAGGSGGVGVSVVHIRYADTVAAPRRVLAHVLRQAGLPYTPEYEARVSEYLARNAADRRRQKQQTHSGPAAAAGHEYALEDYGLAAPAVAARFADYIRAFRL
jgi:hypothetical protein